MGSEFEAAYELNVSRSANASSPLTEVAITEGGIEGLASSIACTGEVVGVKHVKRFCANDKCQVFADYRALAEREICVLERIPAEG